MALRVPAFLNNRTRVRNLLYLLLWGTMILMNAYEPKKMRMCSNRWKYQSALRSG
ncbi:hypothetical protein [Spirosoma linguale]|uniref:hypothetical protein n=1 Tax=Spirosoma linguale TaxID=108 RepID=UPI0002D4C64A